MKDGLETIQNFGKGDIVPHLVITLLLSTGVCVVTTTTSIVTSFLLWFFQVINYTGETHPLLKHWLLFLKSIGIDRRLYPENGNGDNAIFRILFYRKQFSLLLLYRTVLQFVLTQKSIVVGKGTIVVVISILVFFFFLDVILNSFVYIQRVCIIVYYVSFIACTTWLLFFSS